MKVGAQRSPFEKRSRESAVDMKQRLRFRKTLELALPVSRSHELPQDRGLRRKGKVAAQKVGFTDLQELSAGLFRVK